MGGVSYNVIIDPLALCVAGFCGNFPTPTLSGYGLDTFGFIWGASAIWVNTDNITQVTWTPDVCDCN